MVGCSQGRTRVDTCKSEKDSDENRHRGLVKESSREQERMKDDLLKRIRK